MEPTGPQIRNTVRAVIVQDGSILLQKKHDLQKGFRYTLPGGAQEFNETLIEALHRECLEEIGTEIIVGEMLHLADFFKTSFSPEAHQKHQLEILYSCQVPDTYIPKNGPKPDRSQIAIEWIAIQNLTQITLSPVSLTKILSSLNTQALPVYLGKIN